MKTIEEKRKAIQLVYCIRLLNNWFKQIEYYNISAIVGVKKGFQLLDNIISANNKGANKNANKGANKGAKIVRKPIYKYNNANSVNVGYTDYLMLYYEHITNNYNNQMNKRNKEQSANMQRCKEQSANITKGFQLLDNIISANNKGVINTFDKNISAFFRLSKIIINYGFNAFIYNNKDEEQSANKGANKGANITYNINVINKGANALIYNQIGFKSLSSLIKKLDLTIDEKKALYKSFSKQSVYKVTLTNLMLEKLNLNRLFFKNDLNKEQPIKYSVECLENFIYLNTLFKPFNTEKKAFLMDSVILLKEQLNYDNKLNVIYCNKSTLNLLLALIDLNKLYGVPKKEKKGLYNVINHIDNNNKHFLLSIDNLNIKALYNKDNLNYNIFEKISNYYLDLNNLSFEDKKSLALILKAYDKKERLNYINNLTYENLKSSYNDYENFNYHNIGVRAKGIKNYKNVFINVKKSANNVKKHNSANKDLLNILKSSY